MKLRHLQMKGALATLVERPMRLAASLALTLAWILPVGSALAANEGMITSLNATGASNPGDCIEISSSVFADDRMSPSNLYYELFAPDGSLIATRQVDLPRMGAGETASDSWSFCNPPSTGTYTVTLAWSTGNSHNGDIDQASTSFYSVPALGWFFGSVALVLLAIFLYRRRAEFAAVRA